MHNVYCTNAYYVRTEKSFMSGNKKLNTKTVSTKMTKIQGKQQ